MSAAALPRYRWQPTTAEIAREAGISVDDVVRFDHNTSPFATHWAVDVIIEPARHLNEYPGADYRPLREAAAKASGTQPDHIAVGAGIDELILLAGRAFLGPGKRAVSAEPTYPLYRISTAQAGAEWTALERAAPAFELPTDVLLETTSDADVLWLCEPNNPTGNRTDPGEIETLVSSTGAVVVLDAAYAEFSGDRWADVVDRFPNLLVLHTLSKAHGLAGARVGYGIGHPDLVAALDAVRPPGSISSLSVEAACAALADPSRAERTVAAIEQERTDLAHRLGELGWRVLPSQTNFVLCEVGRPALELARAARREGLVIRTFPQAGPLAGYLRFTVRARHEHDRLIECLRRIST